MILKGLRVENVKCFEDLNVAFVPGKNVIIGPNGAGKSTILQSILYSLFHEYPQGKVGGLIRHGEQAAEFALEFDHGGRHYAVERTLRRSGRQEAQLSELGQPDSLADNQKGVTQAVSETLQTTKEVFRDVVLVRQGEIAQIVDMPPSERKVLFDRLLGIHEYEQAWNQCRLLMNTLDKKLSKSMAVMEAHKPSADKLPERRTNLRGLKKELKDKKRLHSEKRTELKAIEAEWKALEELYRQIGTMETQIETQQRHLDTARTKEVELEKAFDDACDELEIVPPAKLTTLLTRLDKDIDKLEENIGIRRKEYNELLEKQGELTPLATREQELRDEIKKLEGEIESTEKEILSQIPHLIKVDYENWLETIKAETSTQNEKLREVQKEIRNAGNIQGKFDTKKAEVKGYEDVILSLQEQISKNEKAARRKGGADWKATARLSLGRLRRKLEKKAEDMESADTEGERLAKEAGKAESTVARFEQELADLQSLIGKKCPKCKQIVDEKHAAELELETKEKLNEAEGRVSDLIARQEEEAKKYKTLKKEAELLDNTIQQIEQLGIYLSTEVDSTKEIKRIEPKLKRARNKLAEQERALAEYDVVALKEEEKLVESQYGTLKDLEGDVKSILKDIKAKEKLDKELDHVSKKVSDLQSSALDTRLPKLDTAIQSMEVRRDNIRTLEGATNNLIGIQGQ
ncbi:MAG: AAA family ATPase, partial [Candidatus Thorarchaeota archaeon]